MIKASTQKASRDFNETLAGPFVDCKKDNNSNSPTTCCLQGQYCDVDLLCHDRETGALSRQYCSDPDWPEESCSGVCPRKSRPLQSKQIALGDPVSGLCWESGLGLCWHSLAGLLGAN